jgi:hypothetical protein
MVIAFAEGRDAMTETGAVPPGTYSGGQRSPVVHVYLCPSCGGYESLCAGQYHGLLAGPCDGCGANAPELHRFEAYIHSVQECSCRLAHERRTGDVDAAAGIAAGRGVTEHAIEMSGGSMQVRNSEPYIERIYPLARWLAHVADVPDRPLAEAEYQAAVHPADVAEFCRQLRVHGIGNIWPVGNGSPMDAMAAALAVIAPRIREEAMHAGFCWAQPEGRNVACDRVRNHLGGHTWEWTDATAAERQRCIALAEQHKAHVWVLRQPVMPLGSRHMAEEPFADLLRAEQ